MKKIYLVAAVIVGLMMSACSDFLDVKPVGKKSEQDYYSAAGVDQVLTGLYARFFTGNSFANVVTNYAYGDVLAGDANKGSNFADQPDFTSLELYAINTSNGYLSSKWSHCYDGVFRSNTVESICNKIDNMDAAAYAHATGQAAFFRGFYHFEIIKLFGAAVPYVGVEDYEANVNPQVSNVDEGGNYMYIWDKVAADFQYAYDNLPGDWNHNGEYGRVNKWAAAALLAKLRMFQSSPYNGTNGGSDHWAEVRTLLENIMANGVDPKGTKYRLADTYEQLFTAGESDWTGESIFDVQTSLAGSSDRTSTVAGGAAVGMSGALGNSGWGFFQPSYDLVNAHIVDDNGLPYMDDSFRQKPALTTDGVEANQPNTDLTVYVDPRVDYTAGRFGTPFYDWAVLTTTDGWVREASNGGYYLNKKLIPKKSDNGSLSLSTTAASTTKNFHIIRYADVLLWYAEALIEAGDYAKAGEYINQVRARAANSYILAADPETMEPTTSPYKLEDKVKNTVKDNAAGNYRIGLYPAAQFTSKESATQALRFERRMELATEGHRWYDLVRWGIAHTEVNKFLNFEKRYLNKYNGAETYQEKWITLPIPWGQINTMQGALVQNVNWL
jgi:hypothetical protein